MSASERTKGHVEGGSVGEGQRQVLRRALEALKGVRLLYSMCGSS